ncbi:MAG: hypothetical protein U0P45_09660 [Acidimicrobiales bacterium]
MNNERRTRRLLAVGIAGAGLAQLGLPAPAGAHPTAGISDDQAPVMWTGTIPDGTPDASIVAHVQMPAARFREIGSRVPTLRLGRLVPDSDGIFTLRSDPSAWLTDYADDAGKVELILFATSDGGKRFGMGNTTVLWSHEDHEWHYDPLLVSTGSVGEVSDLDHPPSSPITMSDATPEMRAQVSRAEGAQRRSARSAAPFPSGSYDCYGGASTVTGYEFNWMTMGKYSHSPYGPNENFMYQTSNTTTAEWGFKAGTSIGVFNASGRVGLANTTSSTAIGGHVINANGTERVFALQVGFTYQRRQYTDCWYEDQPPAGGGRYGFDVNTMLPFEYQADVRHVQVSGSVPTGGGTDASLDPGQTKGRASGKNTTISTSAEVGVGASVLSASVSYNSTNGTGYNVTRTWTNPYQEGTGTKYINGRSGHPVTSGTSDVWAHS